ncbi:hypothetical protein [Streptomyces lincolnensis]|uniref:hypothetical protein n=1 Tax=Streptomyces lincolnensis TaxID=1915 RepID=UPI0037D4ACDA
MSVEHDAYDGVDALMAALTDDPLPDAAREDPAFLAEHRSAQADLALLREQLGVIGHALADPPRPAAAPEPVPPRPPRTHRRARRIAFGGLAVAAVASVVAGMGWLAVEGGNALTSGGDADSSSASKQEDGGLLYGSPHYLACTVLVAEATVTEVEPLPDTEQLRITVHVVRYFKPDQGGPADLTHVIDQRSVTPLHKGDPVLIGVREGSGQAADYWAVGEKAVARDRAMVVASLPESRGLTC